MAEVKRKKGENFDSLMRRFRRRVQSSGKLIQAKKIRFRKGKASKNKQQASAVHRISIAREREYLSKIGKLPVEEEKFQRREQR